MPYSGNRGIRFKPEPLNRETVVLEKGIFDELVCQYGIVANDVAVMSMVPNEEEDPVGNH